MKKQIKDFCDKHGLSIEQFYGKEIISESLILDSLTSIPEGFNPTVGHSLYLNSLTSIPEGFNPTVGGWLDLSSLPSIPKGFNPTVGGSLDLRSLTSIPEGFNPTVGESLILNSLTSIPEGFNPTVGHSLYLRSLTSIPEGFNPTVGHSLDLRSLTSIPECFNPTVGHSLYLSSNLTESTKKPPLILSWQNGRYISADGVFTEVISRRNNVYKVKKINSNKEFYLVTDGNYCAHGDTLKQATEDLKFKVIAEKLKNEPIKADTMINIQYYRTITGACELGVKQWIEENNMKAESYKASELLPILEKTNAYGLERFKKLINF